MVRPGFSLGDASFTTALAKNYGESTCPVVVRSMVYRPHPAEDRGIVGTRVPGIQLTPTAETLSESLPRYDIFISLGSPELVE